MLKPSLPLTLTLLLIAGSTKLCSKITCSLKSYVGKKKTKGKERATEEVHSFAYQGSG